MVYLFFATGTEELEALGTADIIRRAGLDLQIVSITGERIVTGAHGIRVQCDALLQDVDFFDADMLVLPGGMPGATNFADCADLCERLRDHVYLGRPVGAICAAPSILGHKGLLKGKTAVCYEGFETQLTGANIGNSGVAEDGIFITARGAGVAVDFGLKLVEKVHSKEESLRQRNAILCD